MKHFWKRAIILVSAAVLGFFALIAPTYCRAVKYHDAPLVPVVATAMEEGGGLNTFLCFTAVGFILGIFTKMHPLIIGAATVVLFPLIAIAEIAVDRTSHNLLPFECLFYFFYGASAAVGCWISQGTIRFGKLFSCNVRVSRTNGEKDCK